MLVARITDVHNGPNGSKTWPEGSVKQNDSTKILETRHTQATIQEYVTYSVADTPRHLPTDSPVVSTCGKTTDTVNKNNSSQQEVIETVLQFAFGSSVSDTFWDEGKQCDFPSVEFEKGQEPSF